MDALFLKLALKKNFYFCHIDHLVKHIWRFKEFDDLLLNFDHVLCNTIAWSSLFVLVTGDFNATVEEW